MFRIYWKAPKTETIFDWLVNTEERLAWAIGYLSSIGRRVVQISRVS